MNDFEPDLTKRSPFWSLDITVIHVVMIPSSLFCVCPRPSNIHFLEVHISALSTQVARIGLHAKQAFFSAHSTRDVDQNMLARLHQVEALTMDVLQVGIANGSRAPRRRSSARLDIQRSRNPTSAIAVAPIPAAVFVDWSPRLLPAISALVAVVVS
jgi:hypothetical protein